MYVFEHSIKAAKYANDKPRYMACEGRMYFGFLPIWHNLMERPTFNYKEAENVIEERVKQLQSMKDAYSWKTIFSKQFK